MTTKQLNHTAREMLERQITTLMADITGAMRDELKTGLDMLEMARCSVYTEPMENIISLISQASDKFDISFEMDRITAIRLKGVAIEIKESEETND